MSFLARMLIAPTATSGGTPTFESYGTAAATGAATINVNYDAGDYVVVLCGHRTETVIWTADTSFLSALTARSGTGWSARVFSGTASSSGTSVQITKTSSNVVGTNYIAMVFSGVSSAAVATSTGTSTNASPTYLSGFAANDLVLAMAVVNNPEIIIAAPYTLIAISGVGSDGSAAASYAVSSGGTETPGSFTVSWTYGWTTYTVRLSA